MDNIIEKIEKLKKERNAVILAHYYVDGSVQDIADFVGDSYYLSRIAVQTQARPYWCAALDLWGKA